jgi:hypothetical protein
VNPRLAIVITVAAVLVIGITGLVAYADGAFSRPFDARFWRLRLLEPVLLLYWLAAPIFAARSHDRVVATLSGIILLTEKQLDSICAESRVAAARLCIPTFVFVGMLIGTLVGHPWVASTDSVWAVAVRWGLDVLVWGLIGAFVADTLVRVRLTARLHRAPLSLDLLDLTPLTPVAAWGLSLVWVIAGAATIAAAAILDAGIITVYWAPIVTIYLAMAVMAIGLFFSAMWPSHRLIANLKQRELADLKRQLVNAHAELRWKQAVGDFASTPEKAVSAAGWVTLEHRVREIPDWPYNTTILRNLAVTLFLPTAAAIARAFFGLR